ncbi:MAG: phage baseplate assembly protein V [Rhizobiaceae bacterium]
MNFELMPSLFTPRHGLILAEVQSVSDPEGLARVEVVFPLDTEDAQTTAWAVVAMPFAGSNYGAFFVPNVGDVVVLAFLGHDARSPVVLGSVYHGRADPTESLPGSTVDRWVLTGRAGTRIAIVEESAATIELVTPGGASVTVSDDGGGTITAKTGGSTVTLTPSEVSIKSAKIALEAAQITMSAGMVKVDAGIAMFSSVVTANVMQTTTMIAATYTPGAGNIL